MILIIKVLYLHMHSCTISIGVKGHNSITKNNAEKQIVYLRFLDFNLPDVFEYIKLSPEGDMKLI